MATPLPASGLDGDGPHRRPDIETQGQRVVAVEECLEQENVPVAIIIGKDEFFLPERSGSLRPRIGDDGVEYQHLIHLRKSLRKSRRANEVLAGLDGIERCCPAADVRMAFSDHSQNGCCRSC